MLLHGMGGLGKSSLAGRLCERLADYQRLVWVDNLNEDRFLKVLNDRLSKATTELLADRTVPLKKRLTNLLTNGELAEHSALFVLDDFEHSLEVDHHTLQPAALDVLHALLAAIRDTASDSRVIITCRYQFTVAGPMKLHQEGLESLRGADLNKKLKQLNRLSPDSQIYNTRQSLSAQFINSRSPP